MLEISSYFFHYTSPRQNLTDEAKNPIFKSIFVFLFIRIYFQKLGRIRQNHIGSDRIQTFKS